ncbi:MAG: hypothetical protein ABIN36_12395 [Ferruginibacter sp.]
MAVEKYSIGGTPVDTDASEAFADIPQNRVMMVEKLTDKSASSPEVVQGLTSIESVFEHYKPSVDMNFETEEGTTRKETLQFSSVADFGINGITNQSSFLKDITTKKEQYQKIIKQLKSNKVLRQALTDPGSKQNVIDALTAMISELEQKK